MRYSLRNVSGSDIEFVCKFPDGRIQSYTLYAGETVRGLNYTAVSKVYQYVGRGQLMLLYEFEEETNPKINWQKEGF